MNVALSSELQQRWGRYSAFDSLRRITIPLAVTIIAAIFGEPTWELILCSLTWLRLRFAHLIDSQLFQSVFEGKTVSMGRLPTLRAWRSQNA